jgi:hypothetical protein
VPSLWDALSGTAFVALLGAIIGTLVAIVPSVVGGLLVTGLIGHLHPRPSSAAGVQRDLRRIFAVYAGVLNAALLLAVFTLGKGLSSLMGALPYLLVGDACVALMLWGASASISRSMVGTRSKAEHPPAVEARPRAW